MSIYLPIDAEQQIREHEKRTRKEEIKTLIMSLSNYELEATFKLIEEELKKRS